jgi:hypothetical protein
MEGFDGSIRYNEGRVIMPGLFYYFCRKVSHFVTI